MPTQTQLTPEQIEHWRDWLFKQIGAYALIMPISEIQAIHDKIQARIDKDFMDKNFS